MLCGMEWVCAMVWMGLRWEIGIGSVVLGLIEIEIEILVM